MHQVMLTFDVEDFINKRAVVALHRILQLLKKHDFPALFFITGHMAEKLSCLPQILKLLEFHEIGYHSSSHSTRPAIFEFTDVKAYQKALINSLKRETSHINPLTGKMEGEGGIELLRSLFPSKKIIAFRAPGLCWVPPHLDALIQLGVRYDFSACISRRRVVQYGEITFYPYPSTSINRFMIYKGWAHSILENKFTVLVLHPAAFVNLRPFDCIYHKGNPSNLLEVEPKSWAKTELRFLNFELFLKQLRLLQRRKIIGVTCCLSKARVSIAPTKIEVEKIYEKSMFWPVEFFHYKPKFLRSYFFKHFNIN